MRKLFLMLAVAVLVLAGIGSAPVRAQEAAKTIAELAAETPDLSILLTAVGAADPVFVQQLANKDASLTVFAPTNAAFEALLKALNLTAEQLLGNQMLLNVVLAYHVVPTTLVAENVVKLNGAFVGTILPDYGNDAEGAPVNALKIAVADGKVMVNNATVAAADVMAVNGVVHVIDTVLVPFEAAKIAESLTKMMEMTPDASASKLVTLAETVSAAATASTPEFTVLLAAVTAEGQEAVLTTLANPGAYTVFAPTDAAFAAALTALNVTAEALLADKATLTAVLSYHVAAGEFAGATLAKAAEKGEIKIATLNAGTAVTISVKDGKVMVNQATVAAADVLATNGIAHVIDAVILPPAE